MKSFFINWKTTLLGVGALVLGSYEIAVQGGCSLGDYTCWGKPVLLSLLGFFARDADKSSEQSKK